jgi:hypothetical protein
MMNICHANGCATRTPHRLFMCARHWAMVPLTMQNAVWTAYRNAPKGGRARDRDYLSACAKAVEHVALNEGKPQQNTYRRLLAKLDQIEAEHWATKPGE